MSAADDASRDALPMTAGPRLRRGSPPGASGGRDVFEVETRGLAKHEKILGRVLSGRSDANIPFRDLRRLLLRLGFEERVRGSHHIFVRNDVRELINLQREGAKARAYQVKQVRDVLLRYGPGEEG